METTFSELVLLIAAAGLLYAVLRPVRDWLESLILRLLDPRERSLIDVDAETDPIKKKRRE